MQATITKPIEVALEQAIDYDSYKAMMQEFVANGTSSAPDQEETLSQFTKLNDSRMRRWNKTFKLSQEEQEVLATYGKEVIWLTITESWCGDAAHAVPILAKLAAASPNIDLQLVYRDQHLELMDAFLTNGGRSIPKLIMLDKESNKVLGTWGPRPTEATAMVEDYKATHGKLTTEFKQDLQTWYNKNKGQNIKEDLLELLSLK
ncbi:MAG: thioredoxin family protein [Flavobacteriaceae bacterium]|nr:thioredoxin family protein [Flavobacteriaceae bacterium]